MAYAGKCDRCGGFYDLPFEHEARMAGAAWLMNVIKTLKEETGLDFTIRENK